ncbi:MAG: sulfatase-like hydrolase/transferase [Kiritimatiellia bacterium]
MTQDSKAGTPDILFFFSDQHHGLYTGYAGHPLVQTPNMDRVAANGTACEVAYTSCPLCVPARSSMLTGQLPSRNGVFNNNHMIRSDQATFLHSLAGRGYETVLCGRMHFKGPDQRHGFTKRICGDITSLYSGGIAASGIFHSTFGMGGCANFAGAGDSPVLEYDRAVVEAALKYLAKDHDKPQCVVVGTYGPHFPYVAPREFFDLYRGKTKPPASWNPEGRDVNPIVDAKRQRSRTSPEIGRESPMTTGFMLAARAAYLGMISEQDRILGVVREAWDKYLDRSRRKGIFVYSSDHGDTCGEHGVFGKQTFYEGSARIPMIFEGDGVGKGNRLREPVSIMDIGPTLCDMTGAEPPPRQDGRSLCEDLRGGEGDAGRFVLSEWVQPFKDEIVPARMIRKGRWKLIHYEHKEVPDQLFDLETDPGELEDRSAGEADFLAGLKEELTRNWEPERVAAVFAEKRGHLALINRSYPNACPAEPETERRAVPEHAKQKPELVF